LEDLQVPGEPSHIASIGKQYKYMDAKLAGRKKIAETTIDCSHRMKQSEVRSAAWKLINAHDRKPFCFSLARLKRFAFD
jgi:hypothetical protein